MLDNFRLCKANAALLQYITIYCIYISKNKKNWLWKVKVAKNMLRSNHLCKNSRICSKTNKQSKNSQSLIYFYFEGISFRLISGFNERAVSLCSLQEGWHTFLPRLLDSCPLISAWSTSALNTIRDLCFFTPTSFGSTLIIDLSSSCKPCFS